MLCAPLLLGLSRALRQRLSALSLVPYLLLDLGHLNISIRTISSGASSKFSLYDRTGLFCCGKDTSRDFPKLSVQLAVILALPMQLERFDRLVVIAEDDHRQRGAAEVTGLHVHAEVCTAMVE